MADKYRLSRRAKKQCVAFDQAEGGQSGTIQSGFRQETRPYPTFYMH